LAKAYRLPEADAERAKHDNAFAPHSRLPPLDPAQARMAEVIKGALAPLIRELRQTVALARAESGDPLRQIFLCGGGAQLTGLPDHLAEQLEMTVSRVRLEPDGEFSALEPDERAHAVMPLALGTALAGAQGRREIDFRRGEFAYKAGFSFLRAKAPY